MSMTIGSTFSKPVLLGLFGVPSPEQQADEIGMIQIHLNPQLGMFYPSIWPQNDAIQRAPCIFDVRVAGHMWHW